MAAGAAIVVSDFEAAREIVADEKNGLIVPRENVRVLTQAMTRIKDDPALRSRLSNEAKKSAERFSISNHVHAILRFVKSHNS